MHQKVICNTSLTNMSKSEKSAYCRHVFLIDFVKTFSTELKSALNSAFIDTHIEFLKKITLLLLAFFKTLYANAHQTAQGNRKTFFITCLRILLGNHWRVSATKLLKLLYSNCTYTKTYIIAYRPKRQKPRREGASE